MRGNLRGRIECSKKALQPARISIYSLGWLPCNFLFAVAKYTKSSIMHCLSLLPLLVATVAAVPHGWVNSTSSRTFPPRGAIVVDQSGHHSRLLTVQSGINAINATAKGDTSLFIYPGVYTEQVVCIWLKTTDCPMDNADCEVVHSITQVQPECIRLYPRYYVLPGQHRQHHLRSRVGECHR